MIAGRNGDQPVDTGFILFNRANHPHLPAMFAELGVPIVKSAKSFGACIDRSRIVYGLRNILRFNARACRRSPTAMFCHSPTGFACATTGGS